MIEGAIELRSVAAVSPAELPVGALLAAGEPVVLRGLVSNWPLVQAGRSSTADAFAALLAHYNGRPVQYSHAGPEARGRPFYSEDFSALNCEVRRGDLAAVLEAIAAGLESDAPDMYYVASLPVDACFPGLRAHNDLDFAAQGVDAPPSIWIGNRVTASCHYDAPNNLACCAVGRRRFTLFPPDQICNLYPGPLDPTPGGQAVSVVDFAAPDLQRYPRFRGAMAVARSVVLEAGDALFIPSLWWHHVEALDGFNVLINYWWSSHPAWMPTPMHALYHALWTLRDRPEAEKRAWREVFDYYVFGPADRAGAHLPPAARHVLGPIDEALARQLRAMLISKLNR
ncbi:cupin-like domain-containing protein [uncultured Aquimonas sp.]|uniref:cupin-like domain-containing protein n=1 Tax=uncultured Aquimonas sp. TaxID=385483 RepID=UPI00086E12C6|nr:cupin-like domain-containing protein [uncultured Aquimonas sp.]ODU46194.1 MAG: cupin [Xanthomonadaceae bacterium SCN 69-123]